MSLQNLAALKMSNLEPKGAQGVKWLREEIDGKYIKSQKAKVDKLFPFDIEHHRWRQISKESA